MRIFKFLLRVLIVLLAVIGLATVLILGGIGALGWRYAMRATEHVPDNAVLVMDLRNGVSERPSAGFLGEPLDGEIVMHEALAALAAAAKDEHVRGLVARLGGASITFAHAQELRAAVRAFAATGKPTTAYADSFGEQSDGNADYLLASGFKEIWMQPSGELDITGVLVEQPYLRDLLAKAGVQAQIDQRREFKGGADMFNAMAMPEPQRQNLQQLADSLVRQLASAIAEGRSIPEGEARRAIDAGPHLAEDATRLRLVDKLSYWRDLEAALDPEDAKFLDIADYAAQLPGPDEDAPGIALVAAAGQIVGGDGGGLFGAELTTAEETSEAIADAAEDDDVAAIVLRIDSPGGSYLASDTIWREVIRAREKKPVVVSMAGVAASGGYFIAAPASAILADPGTITGSIGVYSGKFVLADLWAKLGIGWDGVTAGANAGMWSPNAPFTEAQWKKFQIQLDRVYADFTAKVASGRKLDAAKVEAVAGGRIYTGEDAVAAGLVDRVGGLAEAVALAKEHAQIPPEREARIIPFPAERDFFGMWSETLFGAQSPALRRAVWALVRAGDAAAPAVERVAPMVEGGDTLLLAPGVWVR